MSSMARTLTVQYRDISHVGMIKVYSPRELAFSDQASDFGDSAGASESEPKDLGGRDGKMNEKLNIISLPRPPCLRLAIVWPRWTHIARNSQTRGQKAAGELRNTLCFCLYTHFEVCSIAASSHTTPTRNATRSGTREQKYLESSSSLLPAAPTNSNRRKLSWGGWRFGVLTLPVDVHIFALVLMIKVASKSFLQLYCRIRS